MPTNNPTEIAETKFTDAKGFTAEQRTAIVELAGKISMRDYKQGIAIMPPGSVDSLLNLAAAEFAQAKKVNGVAQWTDAELTFIRDAKATFSKKAVAEGAPGKRRAEFIAAHGLPAYEAERAKWGATTDVRVPGKSPYKNIKGLKKALNGTLEDTEFNRIFAADKIKKPKAEKSAPVKLTPGKVNGVSLTSLGELYKSDPAAAKREALRYGLKI
jgi:hypothetical protein